MRKIFATLFALVSLAACREWDPVLTLDYAAPPEREPLVATVNTTIAGLKKLYVDAGGAVEIKDHLVIGGQVVSSDRSGNIYRELFLQDATGAICVKIGKSSLYSDYRLGQWVYVDCAGLVIGAYNGMPQLGVEDESSSNYDTAYIDAQYLIDTHIFRGRDDELPAPRTVTEDQLKQALKDGGFKSSLWGAYVRLQGLTYGNQIFAILYAGDAANSQTYLRDKTYGVTTWAMSKSKLQSHIAAGHFDEVLPADVRGTYYDNASSVTMSQYFSLGSTNVQIRTSGYARFADTEIPAAVLGGTPMDATGLLTLYRSDAQFTLLDLDGISVSNP